jgi:hypothetical protein
MGSLARRQTIYGRKEKKTGQKPIAEAARSKARTVFARSNTAIVGSNPTETWMFVCVLC